MAVKSTTLIALRRLFSSGSGDPSSAQANRAISSTLDDLQLDIALWIHERICEFFSLALPSLTQELLRRTNAFGEKEEEVAAQKEAKEWDKNSPPPPYLRKKRNCYGKAKGWDEKFSSFPYLMQMGNRC